MYGEIFYLDGNVCGSLIFDNTYNMPCTERYIAIVVLDKYTTSNIDPNSYILFGEKAQKTKTIFENINVVPIPRKRNH